MSANQKNFSRYLKKYTDIDRTLVNPPMPEEYRTCPWYNEMFDTYKQLGGILDVMPARITFASLGHVLNGKLIFLDEEKHFNRYRALTLKSKIYKNTDMFITTSYAKYCRLYEKKTPITSLNWTSRLSEKQFGESNYEGNFNDNGSAALKQRAFYDMLKDYMSVMKGVTIKRFSIYDTISMNNEKMLIGDLMRHYKPEYQAFFEELIKDLM